MNQDFYYQIGSLTLQLYIPAHIGLDALRTHIPEIKEISKPIKVDLILSFISHNESNVVLKNNVLIVYGNWNATLESDLPHLIYGMLRQYWISHEQYPVHSICFNHHLLIGHTGTGKTTLGVAALNQNIDVFSFDKTVVSFEEDGLYAQLGTDIISIRTQTGNRVLKSYQKRSCKPEYIKNMSLFSINQKPLEVLTINSDAAIHQLYPYFMDCTKTDVFIDNGKAVFNGMVSNEAKIKTFEHLRAWLSLHNNIKFISGEADCIISYIEENKDA